MILPIIRRLRELHPDCEIDILINGEFEYVKEVLPDINNLFLFPRREIQGFSGSPEGHLLEPVQLITDLVQTINDQQFDKVINLTHNRLSAHLMSLIDCDNKLGMSFDKINHSAVDGDWFDFLNNRFYFERRHPFHYVDAFYKGAGNRGGVKFVQEEWVQAEDERELILFQVTSADEKKMWSESSMRAVISHFSANHEVAIIAAPNEVQQLEEEYPGTPVIGATFKEALELCQRARLVVSTDTSIKHLAAMSKTQIVELALGSSNPFETGVRSPNNYIIASTERCAPCSHSGDCFREMHFCGMSIDPQWVCGFIDSVLENDQEKISKLSTIARSAVKVYETQEDSFGMWSAIPSGQVMNWRREFSFLLRRAAYQSLLLRKNTYNFDSRALGWLVQRFDQMAPRGAERALELQRILADRQKTRSCADQILRELRVGPCFPPTLSAAEQLNRFHSACDRFGNVEYSVEIKRIFHSVIEEVTEGSFLTLKKVREFMREVSQMCEWEINTLNGLIEQEDQDVSRVGAVFEKGLGEVARNTREN